jgi:hypothetical protein
LLEPEPLFEPEPLLEEQLSLHTIMRVVITPLVPSASAVVTCSVKGGVRPGEAGPWFSTTPRIALLRHFIGTNPRRAIRRRPQTHANWCSL